MYQSFYISPLGILKIECDEDSLRFISLVEKKEKENPSFLTKKAIQELDEYFLKKRTSFSLPMHFEGTTFQVSVWQELSKIPYGSTVSYQYIAEQINRIKAVRAVGGAIHNNPVMIINPCHRVIGKNNQLVGFASGIEHKKILLDLEQK